MESETIFRSLEIKQSHTLLTQEIANIEEQLYQQRKQRPYNIPFIRHLQQQLKIAEINQKHLRDRLAKLDGSF